MAKKSPLDELFSAGSGIGKSLYDTATYDSAGDKAAAQGNIESAKEAFGGLTPPSFNPVNLSGPERTPDAQASLAGPSAMRDIKTNPEYTRAQMAQMAALSSLAANGGRNAATDANLARIQEGENQNARGQREAILQGAARRGTGGSGASLLAQLASSQGSIDRQSDQDMTVAGQEADRGLAAGQGAAGIGASLENQSFGEQAAKAQADDLVNRFNAQQTTGISEFNTGKNQGVNNAAAAASNQGQIYNNFELPQQSYEDQYQKAAGMSGTAMGASKFYGDQIATGEQAKGNLFGAAIKGGTALATASTGGRIPGAPNVPGDSPVNDTVTVRTSPDEVIVPRTLAKHGSKGEIGDFVKHAAPIKGAEPADKHKAAMLAALKHLAAKGGHK